MEKLNRFVAKHQTGCRIAVMIIWILWALLMINLEFPMILAYAFTAVGAFVCSVAISASADRLLKKPLEILNQQCDPYPMLQESAEQLSYPGNGAVKQVRIINHAMALRQVGQYDQAEITLRSVNIDKHPGLLPIAKVAYYNNLMDLCVLTGKYQEARIWYEKTVQIFTDIKDSKQKKALEKTVATNRAWYCFAGGEYEQALRILEENRPENMLQQIETAMTCARIYLRLGQKEGAVQALRFVEQLGNKLYAVQEARQMLSEMEENTPA